MGIEDAGWIKFHQMAMWIAFSLAAALTAALTIVLSKAGINKLDPMLVFGIESLCMVVITWSLIFSRHLQGGLGSISRKTWLFILAAGVCTTLSSLFSFHSLQIGHASRTSSFEKISLVFSVVLAIVFLKDKYNWQIIAGVILMVCGVLFIAFSDVSK